MRPFVSVRPEDFDLSEEAARLEQNAPGAVATFVGLVRSDGGITALELEHYPAMTVSALEAIAAQAADRWTLNGLTIIHRVGRLPVGSRIVFVGASARHRGDALDGVHFVIDWLKTDAPFWKREIFADGRAQWVEARSDDTSARDRWTAD